MSDKHLYVLWSCPPALAAWQWRPLMVRVIQKLNRYGADDPITGEWSESLPANVQPPHRLHYVASRDGSQVIMEAMFDTDQVNLDTAAPWIAARLNAIEPPVISYDDDGNPVYADDPRPYSEAQVKASLADAITVMVTWDSTWPESRDATAKYQRENSIPWTGIGCVVLAPIDVTGLQSIVAGAYYKKLVDVGDYRLWSLGAAPETLLALHTELWAMAPVQTLGVLAVVQEFGVSFYPSKVREATGMTTAVALARRNRIANYLDSLGCNTAELRASTDEHTQMVGIVSALGHTMDALWRAM